MRLSSLATAIGCTAHALSHLTPPLLAIASLRLSMRWQGIGLLSAGLASVALVTTLPCWSFNSRSASVTEVAARPEPEGVRAALRSPTFLTQAVSAFSLFFYFNGTQTFLVLDLRSRFGFDAGLTSLVYLSCPFWYVLAIFIVPDFAKKYGFQRLITSGLLIVCLASCLLAIPAVNDSLGALLVLWSTANFGFSCCLIPVNARAKLIGMHQTRNGTGQVSCAPPPLRAAAAARHRCCAPPPLLRGLAIPCWVRATSIRGT